MNGDFIIFMFIKYTENIYELSLLRFCSFVDLGKIYSLGDIDSSKLILTFKLSEFTLQIIYSQGSSRVVYLHTIFHAVYQSSGNICAFYHV